ncbi:MAG TPA: PA2779 family protein [Burkholderiales bacterium]|nr:PA2779 family protein [Burkholderiales bacterium]
MSQTFVRWVSRILIACMALLPLQLQAGLIGTGTVVTAADAQAARDTLRAMVERASAAGKLQSWGVTREQAQARIAALTDMEAADLAARAERAPAGADGAGIGILIVLIFLLWRFVLEPVFNPDTQKGDGKKK